MTEKVRQEVKALIKKLNLDCSVEEFQNKVDWKYISRYQKLSENFIREFQDRVNWINISIYQKLSEEFIREFQDKIHWFYISHHQKLSLEFIREFQDRVYWKYISCFQKLSLKFIREFKDYVNWEYISIYQKLSLDFIREFQDRIDVKLYNLVNKKISFSQKIKEVKSYCKKYDLEYDYKNRCFYAYRNHNFNGSGVYNKTITYKKGKYYKDWHLDMRKSEEASFGLGIWPEGNVKIKVLIKDWGVDVGRNNGKARVWGFKIVLLTANQSIEKQYNYNVK